MSSSVHHFLTEFNQLLTEFNQHRRWLVLTGAGISLSTGIPTYRNDQGQWIRSTPIKHHEFIQNPTIRKRYWARSILGWPSVANATPSNSHIALAKLERQQRLTGLITQNVDRLHQQAGHQQVIDLHGRLDRVRCLQCSNFESREQLQQRLLTRNPFLLNISGLTAPDGDASFHDPQLEESITEQLQPVPCLICGGTLMPDVVFFGGTLAKETHTAVQQLLQQSQGVMVVGSSLMVYSGYRICKQAYQEGKPLLIINRGVTRADELASLKISGDCEYTLQQLVENTCINDPL